jgi:hypothetical protein
MIGFLYSVIGSSPWADPRLSKACPSPGTCDRKRCGRESRAVILGIQKSHGEGKSGKNKASPQEAWIGLGITDRVGTRLWCMPCDSLCFAGRPPPLLLSSSVKRRMTEGEAALRNRWRKHLQWPHAFQLGRSLTRSFQRWTFLSDAGISMPKTAESQPQTAALISATEKVSPAR